MAVALKKAAGTRLRATILAVECAEMDETFYPDDSTRQYWHCD